MGTGTFTVSLRLLDEVRWRDAPVAGERAQALLAALALDGGRTLAAERLIDLVWGEEAPANGAKGLHVLVSRTRTACGGDVIVREGAGYRLGVDASGVDVLLLAKLVRDAGVALDADAARAAALAREALALSTAGDSTVLAADGEGDGPLHAVRIEAAAALARARVILARAVSRTGAHAEALPGLEAACANAPDDERLLADLLHSEAAARGPAAALERYERFRRELRERLGASPGQELQRVQRELLALEEPVRSGLRYDANALLGRDRDLERLRALLAGARVVSIVGPGGLGKTRLAHVLARAASTPVVHFVELVGVTVADDVLGEVGSVLGVRDSVTTRRALTASQRTDIRTRVAQQLAQAPALLVLDNCEHLVEPVAALVAFLVATVPDLSVLTTSRAPLAISAERVYQLGALETADATELFEQRARAARADVSTPPAAVRSIVTRLDGLPLAIELAAAKVRVMAVEEIDRRLANRFALLRGGDRSAPDRHQTLLAVIDWSWNLLHEPERRALRRLALFHDGFTLDAAESVLGPPPGANALEAVQALVEQSLLSVEETATGTRYRMLETVREFGRMQLADAGEDAEARRAQLEWATDFAGRYAPQLAGRGQIAAIDAMGAEEVNLADELRGALTGGAPGPAMALLAALGMFWSLRGEHVRLVALIEVTCDAVRDWSPPPEAHDATRAAMALMLNFAVITSTAPPPPIHELLRRLGPGEGDPWLSAAVRVTLAYEPEEPARFAAALRNLIATGDRETARSASQWLGHVLENAGDHAGARAATQAALDLTDDQDGPWQAAILQTQLAQLWLHDADRRRAVECAQAALPVMRRLGAGDDEMQLHALIALCAISDGQLDVAAVELEQLDRINTTDAIFGGSAFRTIVRAELALANGERGEPLRSVRETAAEMRAMSLPGLPEMDASPWALFGDTTALALHASYATGAEVEQGAELFQLCRANVLHALAQSEGHIDFPATGTALLALASWLIQRGDGSATAATSAARLMALSERFSSSSTLPTLSPERVGSLVETTAAGALGGFRDEYRDARPADLRGRAHAAVEELPG
jgi:predicted ATPase/DNA-binding SARP family transcriptional activator